MALPAQRQVSDPTLWPVHGLRDESWKLERQL
jgi:hypothetical protein